jgi:ATP-dependent protease ClpP protease subunit
MTADQARDFGLIDKVLNTRDEVDGDLFVGKPAT